MRQGAPQSVDCGALIDDMEILYKNKNLIKEIT